MMDDTVGKRVIKLEQAMRREIMETGKKCGLPEHLWGEYCHAQRDGDCIWQHCPQNRDNEPLASGRHCPLDIHEESRGYQ